MIERRESLELPAVADSIGTARTAVARFAADLPQSLRDDAALLVSELMSNAVRHGAGIAVLTLSLSEEMLTVAVHDDGAELPMMGAGISDPAAASGRGLGIVERLAAQWGVDVDRGAPGKTVWFRLAVAKATWGQADREGEKV
ncbi:ATP-binding protein [Nocardioides sp. BP30]|uniref:ATP-binding protein n=1 Tax=Nocardioides sp. BP30 TaxID=3036374 RepID=UPI00246955F0|nr:ATP-binding protein [Nocardioides sp. BP30]WGL50363.1 ATP-binding protein [Nocardioides sp. BP30]